MRTLRVAPEWLAVRDPGLVTWCPVSQGRPELTSEPIKNECAVRPLCSSHHEDEKVKNSAGAVVVFVYGRRGCSCAPIIRPHGGLPSTIFRKSHSATRLEIIADHVATSCQFRSYPLGYGRCIGYVATSS
jgi:hypothetical protein